MNVFYWNRLKKKEERLRKIIIFYIEKVII